MAERASRIARQSKVSLSGLQTTDLPGVLQLTLDGHKKKQSVSCFEDDRELAFWIARRVRFKLSQVGLRVNDALREL